MNTGDRGKKTVKNPKSGLFKFESGPGPSSKRWLRSDSKKSSDKYGASEVSNVNSDGDNKKSNIGHGKGKKRKLFSSDDGSEKPSKRRVHGDHTEHSDESVVKENGEKTIIDLPGELFTKIIDMVPISQWSSLEFVNHRFQEVMHGMWSQLHEIRLDELVYKKKPYQVMGAALRKFVNRAPNIASISGFAEFFDESKPIRRSLIQLLSKFQHLQSIDFSGGNVVTARNFAKFLDSSASRQSWKRLDIVGGIYGEMKNNKAVRIKNQPALKLECFKFKMESLSIFDRFLPPIDWSGLKKLVITRTSGCAKEVLSIVRQCSQVAHLEIIVPRCGEGDGQPSYADLIQGVADLGNLSFLKIHCNHSSDTDFRDALLVLIQDLGRRGIITELALVGYDWSYQLVGSIIDHLPRLKSLELNVSNCTKPMRVRLANEMTQLETLKFNGVFVRPMINLQCLHLEKSNINSEDLKSLGHLRKLKELRIKRSKIGSEIVESWTRHAFGSCMETLELVYLDRGISPEVMGDFFKNMPRLSSFRMAGVTDDIVEAIVESCPNLVVLDLSYSPDITFTGIQSVVDRCSQLKYLRVVGQDEWFPAELTVGKYRKITFKAA